jgi:hypothetical protein
MSTLKILAAQEDCAARAMRLHLGERLRRNLKIIRQLLTLTLVTDVQLPKVPEGLLGLAFERKALT